MKKTAFSLLLMLGAWNLPAASPAPSSQTPWVVGVENAPPFSMKDDSGEWGGISVDLWKEIAENLGRAYVFQEVSLNEMLDGLKSGKLAAGLGDLAITTDLEKQVDFTHPYLTSGLGIAMVKRTDFHHWMRVLEQILSWGFLKLVLFLAAILLLSGWLVWLLERKNNPGHFGGRTAIHGIGSAFWWSAVTMTAVGYGDKVPSSFGGRSVAVVWMFVSLIIVSGFTGAVASSITASRFESQIRSPADLRQFRVACVKSTPSESYLLHAHIHSIPYASPEAAMQALSNQQVDAFVYDEPVLKYMVNNMTNNRIEVLPNIFQRQSYSLALPNGSPIREKVNTLLLEKINRPLWQDILFRYLGQ